MKLENGVYATEAGSTVKISGKYSGVTEVDFDWFEEEAACVDCVPNAYPEIDNGVWFLTWACEECGGGRARLNQ